MPKRKDDPKPMPHQVYLVRSEVGLVKVGYSRDARRRLVAMRADSGCEIALVHVWQFDSRTAAQEHEAAMHKLLEWAWVRGEWHRLSVQAAVETGDALISRNPARVKNIIAAHRAALPPTVGTEPEHAV